MKKRWNGFAVSGFVMSFTNCLLGLIFSIIGVNSASTYNEKGKGLAIAGIVISILNLFVTIASIIILSIAVAAIFGSITNIGDLVPNGVVDRTRETVIETYAKSQYEEKIYKSEGSKKIKKNTKEGYVFTVEDLEKDTPGIKEIYKSCNLKESKVTIIPIEPYGEHDYIVKTQLSCN